jgi:predicted DNA binding CopG/RHH family protein
MHGMEVPMKQKNSLDQYEKQIESKVHSYVPISGTRRRKIETILGATRKTKNINIRITQQDLENLRRSAEQEGIPYQTLISSVLHKYLSGRLVDEISIRKSVEILSRRGKSKVS